jgi:hypothetical protein
MMGFPAINEMCPEDDCPKRFSLTNLTSEELSLQGECYQQWDMTSLDDNHYCTPQRPAEVYKLE